MFPIVQVHRDLLCYYINKRGYFNSAAQSLNIRCSWHPTSSVAWCLNVIFTAASELSELSVQHILEPNKIMQLSNLKPRIAAKNNTSIKLNPLIASLYFLPLQGFTVYCHNTGESDVFTPSGLYFSSLYYILQGQLNSAYNT